MSERDVLLAATLHDTMEDTETSREKLVIEHAPDLSEALERDFGR